MFLHRFSNLKYIFSTIKRSFIPAFFLLLALLIFYAQNPFAFEFSLTLHCLFLAFSALVLSLLYLANRSKPFFTSLVIIICYLIINQLKLRNGSEFTSLPEFRTMCFLLPINLLILYFIPAFKLKSSQSRYIILALLGEIVLLQYFCPLISNFPLIHITLEAMPILSCTFWAVTLTVIAVNISVKNTIINTGLFYVVACLFLGMIYADNVSGLTAFFLSSILIVCFTTIADLYNNYHYDYLESVGSYNSYLSHANSKFPFKYTVVLFGIDNGDKLKKAIGNHKYTLLEQLVVNKILEQPYDLSLYRYNDNELIMAFKNEDAKHTKEFADNIRHIIAASEFIFADKKNIKITISACVSEKTRKDLNAFEVTERAHNALNKSHHFNCNVTTVA